MSYLYNYDIEILETYFVLLKYKRIEQKKINHFIGYVIHKSVGINLSIPKRFSRHRLPIQPVFFLNTQHMLYVLADVKSMWE